MGEGGREKEVVERAQAGNTAGHMPTIRRWQRRTSIQQRQRSRALRSSARSVMRGVKAAVVVVVVVGGGRQVKVLRRSAFVRKVVERTLYNRAGSRRTESRKPTEFVHDHGEFSKPK